MRRVLAWGGGKEKTTQNRKTLNTHQTKPKKPQPKQPDLIAMKWNIYIVFRLCRHVAPRGDLEHCSSTKTNDFQNCEAYHIQLRHTQKIEELLDQVI